MHEGGVAREILDVAEEHAAGRRITRIRIGLGSMSGVNRESLQFHLESQAPERGMAQAVMEITGVPAEYTCSCGNKFEPQTPLDPCPACGAFTRNLTQGTDCTVETIEVEDE